MTGREIVRRTIRFETPERYARDLPEPYGSDFARISPDPHPETRPRGGVDAWGCVWECYENTSIGEVKDSPLKNWDDFDKLKIPNVTDDSIWESAKTARAKAGGKYLVASGMPMYARLHYVRGLENTWCDIREEPENLRMFIRLLADMNIAMIERYGKLGADGFMFCDDWGLQDRLMINPEDWKSLWKPEYGRVFTAARECGMDVIMHSCGYVIDILGDLVEAGLGAVHMDQQMNMGLERLGDMFRGRLTFYSPVDIQAVMPVGSPAEIRAYCRKMSECLGTREGGFIPRWYGDPKSAGHPQENIDAMCDEFMKLSAEIYGK